MCRWLAYSGTPIFLEDLVTLPSQSLAHQSLAAMESGVRTHADGFGIGWYGDRERPGLYRDVLPAWNDTNLKELSAQIRSPLFLAHVRASTGSPIQRTNSHPFRYGTWLFMHNGEVYGYDVIRPALVAAVAPELLAHIQGSTDSEVLFFLALTFGLETDPIAALERMAGFVEKTAGAHGIDPALQMTLALSDGKALYAIRYSSHRETRSLFLCRDDHAVIVASEPVDEDPSAWEEIPDATALVVRGTDVELRPFAPA